MSEDFTKRIMDIVSKEFGNDIMVSGKSVADEDRLTIPISPALNIITGGIPEGSWVTISGRPKTGKSSTLLHFAGHCQKPKYGSKHIYYLDVEGRIKKMNLEGTKNLSIDKQFTVIHSTEDKILSAQDYLNIAEKILMNHSKCVVIIDSFSALCHEKEITDGVGTFTRGGGAALLAQFCRQMANVVTVKKSIICGVTHLMANTSGYGAATMEKGGNAIAYQVDIKLKVKGIEPWLIDAKRIGQKITWITECTATGMPPGMEIESCLRYGHGIDEAAELVKLGQDFGLITKAGSWLTCDFMKNHLMILGAAEWSPEVEKKCRAQGGDKMQSLLAANPGWMSVMENDLSVIMSSKA